MESDRNSYYLHEVALQEKEDNILFKTGTIKNGTSGKVLSSPLFNLLQKLNNVNNKNIQNQNRHTKEIFGFEIDADAKVNEDLLEELSIHDPNAQVDSQGNVTVYHRTTPQAIQEIKRTGVMTALEDALFFSSEKDGYATDYGESVLELKIPSTVLQVNDIFADGGLSYSIAPLTLDDEELKVYNNRMWSNSLFTNEDLLLLNDVFSELNDNKKEKELLLTVQ